jgi:hypothetical protein
MNKKYFLTRHLHDANENYFEHLGFTIKVGCTLIVIGVIAMLHGLMPFIFTHTASGMLCKLMDEMKARKTMCEARSRQHPTNNP